jgi:streptogramin lyase
MIVVLAAGASGAAAKGSGPTSIAAGYGSVWVGMGNGDVLALPPSLHRVERPLAGGAISFVHGLTARYGALWILRDRLTRLDPSPNTARDVPGTASATAFAVAAGAGAVWIADDGSNEILRVDPKRTRVQARIRVPGRAWGVAAGSRNVIVVSVPTRGPVTGPRGVRFLRRVDPKTNRLSPPLARLGCDVGVAVGSRAVWTFDACSGVLARRDPATLQLVRQTRTHVLWQVPALGFGSVWLASRGGTLRIDPVTLHTSARIGARSLSVAVGSGSVWALDTGGGRRPPTIRKIDPATNRVVKAATIPVQG